MDKVLLYQFNEQLSKLQMKEYILSSIAYGAAPTLKGLKPASLMAFSSKGKNLLSLWEFYKREVSKTLQLSYFELRQTEDWKLVLFYNEHMLQVHMEDERILSFLEVYGYEKNMILFEKLYVLKERFKEGCPHEIGVFLGIPLDDIISFIRLKGSGCLFSSKYWKVYHNPEEAKYRFHCFDRAKASVAKMIIDFGEYKNTEILTAI